MNNTIENEDKENEDSNEADSESFVSLSDKDKEKKKNKSKIRKKQSNWDSITKKYRKEEDPLEKEKGNQEVIEKKAVEKSPKERFVRFDEILGNGSFKRVYKAYDLDDAKEVAWNVINVGNMSDEEIKKIIDEINLIKQLKNPRILNYISGWVNDAKKEVVFITDIFSGGSLKQYLTKIKYPRLKVIKHWCKEILMGLKYMHEQENPIIHRDIKCDNIFIDKNDGKITIGDLGYSCVLKNDYANSFSGTPEFMAPEVFESKYGINADIYSFEKPYKECETIWKIYTYATQGILPKALNRIHHEKIKEFIKNCLKKENERPKANDLLNSEFLNDTESEENNYPVPLLDEDCKFIINQESLDTTIHHGIGMSKLKSQSDDKKPLNPDHRRDSIIEKHKFSDMRCSIKNSPISVKKPLHVRIEDKFALNLQDMTKSNKAHNTSIKPISSSILNRDLASTVISPNNSNKNVLSPNNETTYFNSSSESDKNIKKKAIKSSTINIEVNNPFFKRSKPMVFPGNVKTNILKDTPSQGPFSKLELFVEKENTNGCQIKHDADKIFIVLKIKKPQWKNKKSK